MPSRQPAAGGSQLGRWAVCSGQVGNGQVDGRQSPVGGKQSAVLAHLAATGARQYAVDDFAPKSENLSLKRPGRKQLRLQQCRSSHFFVACPKTFDGLASAMIGTTPLGCKESEIRNLRFDLRPCRIGASVVREDASVFWLQLNVYVHSPLPTTNRPPAYLPIAHRRLPTTSHPPAYLPICPSAHCPLHTAHFALRRSISLEGITVRILAADTPPPHLESRHVDSDDEQFPQVAGRRL